MNAPSAQASVTVDRVSGLAPAEVRRRYCDAGKPVIVTDAATSAGWAAPQFLTPAYLRSHFAWKPVRTAHGWISLGDALDMLERSDPENPAPYPLKMQLRTEFPELLPLLNPMPLPHSRPNRLTDSRFRGEQFGSTHELFIGGPGGNFPYIHIDFYRLHAWITEIHGRKEFTLYPPEDAPHLYVCENGWQSGIERPWDPDLGRYPLFAMARPTTLILEPGESLFIPNGFWHTARSLEVTLSIAFDQLNRLNTLGYIHDVWRFNKRFTSTWLLMPQLLGLTAWHGATERLRRLLGRG